MDKIVALQISVTTLAIGSGVSVYMWFLRKKLRRFVLRYEEISKYFKKEVE